MSQRQTYFEKPKVRFCQPSVDDRSDSTKSTTKAHDNDSQEQSNKPRIRSIVAIENPLKLVNENLHRPSTSFDVIDNVEIQCTDDNDINTKTISKTTVDTGPPAMVSCVSSKTEERLNSMVNERVENCDMISEPHANSLCSSVALQDPETTKPPNDVGKSKSHHFDAKKNSKVASETRVCRKKDSSKIESHSIPISKSSFQNGFAKYTGKIENGTIPKSKVCVTKFPPRCRLSKSSSTTSRNTGNLQISTKAGLPQTGTYKNLSRINRLTEKNSAKGLPSSSQSVTTAKVLPGLKNSKIGSKVLKTRSKSSSPVKKTILRDVNSRLPKAFVGPGVLRRDVQPHKLAMGSKMTYIRPGSVLGDKFSRPEYNSIMCTINKLREVEKEKFVTDVEHLPLVYKNMINEKVAAALDFSPDEAIYKDLVDLSINENQWPSRMTRSKDPELRHRDMVPKLSDFYTPTYSEEYYVAVPSQLHDSEMLSNWSAFAISDKIFGWKHDMDQCY